ncbi:DUF4397 domain-containing protein [Quadrisphaera sp. KR29]|uniref:DUF4397 domain-containing protein n=1 Tax=Quadrisphaera sp. KR29 TaxID=3461391 RepID=UPI00404404D2
MRKNTCTAAVAATAASLVLVPAAAASAAGSGDTATVSVLHAVPGLTVDVYANGSELIPDFTPGTLTDPQQLPAGSYDLAVFQAGQPSTGTPAIQANDVEVPAGANVTVVAHLDAEGQPTLTPFVNDTSSVPAGDARLTVRHVAAAPAVDVRAGGEPVVQGLTNPNEASLEVPGGTVSADVVLAGTSDVAAGPTDLSLPAGTSTVVYAWGNPAEGGVQLALQRIEDLGGAPGGVAAGTGGLLDDGAVPTWVLATSAGALGVAVAAGVGAAAVRSRRATAGTGDRAA